MSYYNQNQPPVGVPPPQGYPPEGYPKDAYPPAGYPPQQGYPQQGYPPQGYPPQYAPQYGAPPPQKQSNSSAGLMEGWIFTFYEFRSGRSEFLVLFITLLFGELIASQLISLRTVVDVRLWLGAPWLDDLNN
ncbi:cysteine-rich and transmembrane domain-containing WIH2-like [Olea europaea subsp. europaea]|uniref:Cysteine-rich and transmembrane domain-containing WIH2-like n=1 Tax=Olea europaea subsp. europaea TaxID=158383 RepID=A0A8S0QHK6_OLEEU|nr:cysteine-rich and transmembrane domain-containing WIH2-like [Olea europaea subsp. europaea]